MKATKPSIRPVLMRLALVNTIVCAVIDGGIYWIYGESSARIEQLIQNNPQYVESLRMFADASPYVKQVFLLYFVPASLVVCIFATLLSGFAVRGLLRRPDGESVPETPAAGQRPSETEAGRQRCETDQRTYLHLITVLQNEGRLLDFFAEDLDQYADDQIGAAVRSIHDNCKKAIRQTIDPQSVLTGSEGDEVTVEADFDPNALKLVGNVTGKPPFKGIVRHRGWRAGKLDIPTFSGRKNAGIIASAEVEVG
ncbi:MAG: DUF2760 domain-containing protein [Desulfatitalea sp.]|nr:DUF2760 domain-containing protein [Desulfatitalea sp.]NNK02203.1 DUF2760 domain-containing protein [Desulfatitalea sp.]